MNLVLHRRDQRVDGWGGGVNAKTMNIKFLRVVWKRTVESKTKDIGTTWAQLSGGLPKTGSASEVLLRLYAP